MGSFFIILANMKPALVFILINLSLFTVAQQNAISGKVLDATSRAFIPNASVFINNSSRGTTTNAAGEFVLNDIPDGSYELVISSIGYATVVHPFTSAQLPLKLSIELKRKIAELDSVTVEPFDPNGWKKWGRTFMDNFIGTTPAARECTIKNYKVIRFRYSKKDNRVTAVADEPLIIENEALGYIIQYQLEGFVYDMSSRAIVYLGYPLFTDLSENKKRIRAKWQNNRQTAYRGSFTHFTRSLYNNLLAEEGFEVKRQGKVHNTEKDRVKAIQAAENRRNVVSGGRTVMRLGGPAPPPDSAAYYKRVMAQPDVIERMDTLLLTADSVSRWANDSTRIFYFDNHLRVTFTKGGGEFWLNHVREMRVAQKQRSTIFLVDEHPITIMRNGAYYPPQNVFMTGYWAWSEKIAHLLPIDYEIPKEP
jgi:hypothetical protein